MPPQDRHVLAVVGAECSGKTTLALAVANALGGQYVPEQLRGFVAQRGRTPSRSEQLPLMRAQMAAAAVPCDWVVSDGGALMTAVYSVLYFDDHRLIADAVRYHRDDCALTVWCGINLPWSPDPGQRDGLEHRTRADAIIASIVAEHGLEVLRVDGGVAERLAAVLGAVAPPG